MHHNSDHLNLISSHNVYDLETSSLHGKNHAKFLHKSKWKFLARLHHRNWIKKKIFFFSLFSLLGFPFSILFFIFHFNCTTAQPKLKLMSTETLIFVQLELHFVEFLLKRNQIQMRSFDLLSTLSLQFEYCFCLSIICFWLIKESIVW